MIIINKVAEGDTKYFIYIGENPFCVYAQSEAQAVERVVETLDHDWYFDNIEVQAMAMSVNKSIEKFVTDADLYHCPKYNIYLPKLKIQEVSK